ncbi:MAG: hypothetical protein Q8P84_05370 [Deltaproteobacteria bacterium]|nr:hypothetical protein [Deltaproteobacteria bacterium]
MTVIHENTRVNRVLAVSASPVTGYLKETLTPKSLYNGSQYMFGHLFETLDKTLPANEWFQKKFGWEKSDTFVTEVAILGGVLIAGAALLPAAVLTGLMVIGIGSAVYDYGKGFYHYQNAVLTNNAVKTREAVAAGQEAAFAAVLGTAFLAMTKVPMKMADGKIFQITPEAAARIRSFAQGVCLFDDPVHIFNIFRKVPS